MFFTALIDVFTRLRTERFFWGGGEASLLAGLAVLSTGRAIG